MCFLQLVGKRYPLKAVSHTKKKKKKEVEEEDNYSLQTEPTREHKALSGTETVSHTKKKKKEVEEEENLV